MCEAEKVLNWLITEVEQKSNVVREVFWALPCWDHETHDRIGDLESDLRALVREAKQRMKEAKGQVVA